VVVGDQQDRLACPAQVGQKVHQPKQVLSVLTDGRLVQDQEPGPQAEGSRQRGPLLLAGQWFQAPIDLWILMSREQQVRAAIVGAAGCLLLAALIGAVFLAKREGE